LSIPILLVVLSIPCTALCRTAEVFQARVIAIQDGDTITVLRDDKPVKIRLHGIDAPEKKQAFGSRSKQLMGDLVHGQKVTIEARDKDRYGRLIAIVILPDGCTVNHEMVRAGMAWWY
jgi:micrococcal nuclease